MKYAIRPISKAALSLVLGWHSACQPQRANYVGEIARAPDPLALIERELDRSSSRDRLVYLLESGLLHLRAGRLERARTRFSEASDRIGLLFGEGQKDSLTWTGKESDKEFKGEAHEQSLCCFFDGWTRLASGDTERAASCFRAAQLFDRSASKRSDLALAVLFEAITRQRLGQTPEAEDLLRWLVELEPQATQLAERVRANDYDGVVLVAAGVAPSKQARGEHFSTLSYLQEPFSDVVHVSLEVGGVESTAPLLCSTLHQATERGPRGVDTLNAGEAAVKRGLQDRSIEGVRAAASIEVQQGSVPKGVEVRGADDIQAAYLIAAGALLVVSATGRSTADIRAWTTLPEYLFVGLIHSSADASTLAIRASDVDHARLPAIDQRVAIPATNPGELRCIYVTLGDAPLR